MRYLRTLSTYFKKLRHEMDFSKLSDVFVPMVYSVLLVCKHSPTYNTKTRISVLMQEMCNAIIMQVQLPQYIGSLCEKPRCASSQGQQHVNSDKIFHLIQDENVVEAIGLLQKASR